MSEENRKVLCPDCLRYVTVTLALELRKHQSMVPGPKDTCKGSGKAVSNAVIGEWDW